jgi:uncharacterized protein Yka (UPF0111/DUF47 family)
MLSIRTKNDNYKLLTSFIEGKKAVIDKALVYKEFGTKEGNEHFHYHLEISNLKIEVDSLMRYIRTQLHGTYDGNSSYYVKKVKSVEKHIDYISKDLERVHCKGFTKEEIKTIETKAEAIQKDKQLPVYKKLFNRYIQDENSPECNDKIKMVTWILKIIKQWESLPPTRSMMNQIITYISIQSTDDFEHTVMEYYC